MKGLWKQVAAALIAGTVTFHPRVDPLSDLKKAAGYSLEYRLEERGCEPRFSEEDIRQLAHVVTAPQLASYLKARKADGSPLLSAADIIIAKQQGIDPFFITQLSNFYDGQNQIFDRGDLVIDAYRTGASAHYFTDLHQWRLPTGELALRIPEHLIATARTQPSVTLLKQYALLRGKDLKPVFNQGIDIVRNIQSGLQPKEFLSYLQEGLDGKSAYRFHQLGLSAKEAMTMPDSGKPDALVIYPQADHNKAFENEGSIALFKGIQARYDVLVRFCGTEEELLGVLQQLPHHRLFYLAGHGSQTDLQLGEPGMRYSHPAGDERYSLDISDRYQLRFTRDKGEVFLHSCGTALGGENAKNLANVIIDAAAPRRVFAASRPFSSDQIHSFNALPFTIAIHTVEQGYVVDVTYSKTKDELERDVPFLIPDTKRLYRSPSLLDFRMR